MHDVTMAMTIWRYIESSLDRLVTLALTMTEDERAAKPPVDGANSIATLVGHTLANAEENLLGTLAGESIAYDRESDFEAPVTDARRIEKRWTDLRQRMEETLPRLHDEHLLEPRAHPRRGGITGLEVLVVVARHASEHLAHAELTRDWLVGRRG